MSFTSPSSQARQRGVILIAAGIWIMVLVAIAAIAVEIARLTDTATEVQVAADSAALGAAVAVSRNQDGVTAGQNAAAANYADGRLVATGGVQIDIGHYDSDPTANPHFTATCTPGIDCNAAKATVTVSNVTYILGNLLGGQQSDTTSVTKTAVAAIECQGSAYPLPLAVCTQALDQIGQDDLCGGTASSFHLNPNNHDNGCWTSLSTVSASSAYAQSIFPPQCGGTPIEAFVGSPINLQNGVANSVWQALQCCIACQNVHDYEIPVVDCSAIGSCNTAPPVLGFATIHINDPTDVNPPGGGNTNCGNVPWGCSARVHTEGATGLTVSQICKTDLAGRPGGTSCNNYASTVAPVLGQLP